MCSPLHKPDFILEATGSKSKGGPEGWCAVTSQDGTAWTAGYPRRPVCCYLEGGPCGSAEGPELPCDTAKGLPFCSTVESDMGHWVLVSHATTGRPSHTHPQRSGKEVGLRVWQIHIWRKLIEKRPSSSFIIYTCLLLKRFKAVRETGSWKGQAAHGHASVWHKLGRILPLWFKGQCPGATHVETPPENVIL